MQFLSLYCKWSRTTSLIFLASVGLQEFYRGACMRNPVIDLSGEWECLLNLPVHSASVTRDVRLHCCGSAQILVSDLPVFAWN